MSVSICLSLTMQLNCLKFIITGEVYILYQVTSNPLKNPRMRARALDCSTNSPR